MKRILVVEDNPDVADLVALHLRDAGYGVDTTGEGRIGLAHALRGEHDLVVLDLMLPDLDGLEICRQLRAREQYIPILMLTARSAELDRVLGLEIGGD
ncbi:MAG: response regulator, partial [Myxococcota bacterium]